MILVVDASVAAMWFLRFRRDEEHAQSALTILAGIDDGRVRMLQPPHFIAEMGAVLACEKPQEALADLADLMAVEFEQAGDPVLYETACTLALRLGHHLFDTLYHAVALHTPGAVLVTADRKYFDKARTVGDIAYLPDLAL
ncbi:MAG: type II toxin-antitoxin system VapC family toxin [Rhodocyclales bacterium]|nr:type II toxin-antitoxin system VapC family toxin [Rhodocyclales bacterium]